MWSFFLLSEVRNIQIIVHIMKEGHFLNQWFHRIFEQKHKEGEILF